MDSQADMNDNKRADFKYRLEMLREVITSALGFFRVWQTLQFNDSQTAFISLERQDRILKRWDHFFSPTVLALRRMSMIEFAKVFDTDTRTASIVNLLKDAEQHRKKWYRVANLTT
jgi:hypothetical protein